MFYDYKSLKTNAGDNRKNDLKQNDLFYVKLDDDYDVIFLNFKIALHFYSNGKYMDLTP